MRHGAGGGSGPALPASGCSVVLYGPGDQRDGAWVDRRGAIGPEQAPIPPGRSAGVDVGNLEQSAADVETVEERPAAARSGSASRRRSCSGRRTTASGSRCARRRCAGAGRAGRRGAPAAVGRAARTLRRARRRPRRGRRPARTWAAPAGRRPRPRSPPSTADRGARRRSMIVAAGPTSPKTPRAGVDAPVAVSTRNIRVRTTSPIPAPASARAVSMIVKQRRAWALTSSGALSRPGTRGWSRETRTRSPTRTAREKPMVGSKGDPEAMR